MNNDMNLDKKNFNISIQDNMRCNFKDSSILKTRNSNTDGPNLHGVVLVHEIDENGGKKLISKSDNLIVYRGRSMAITRMFNKDLNWNSSTPTALPYYEMKDKFIAFFAVGTGGSSSSNNQTPLTVNSTDYGLTTHGDVSGSVNSVVINGRSYIKFDDNYPNFISEPEVKNNSEINGLLENVNYGGQKRDTYLISQVNITLDNLTANSSSGTQGINEVGLFMAESDDPNYDFSSYTNNDLHLPMWARTTMPTITKNVDRAMTLSWYIYF